jgi:hypothetical protein
VTVLLAALALAVPVPVPTQTGFETPSGNIVCNAGPYRGKPLLACTVISLEDPKRGQKVWALPAAGRVSVGYVLGNAATDYPKLAYGRSWSWHTIRCSSARRGLTCRNPAGHGFFLSRASQRVF